MALANLKAAANKAENLNWIQWVGAIPVIVAIPVSAIQAFNAKDWTSCVIQVGYGIAVTITLLWFSKRTRRIDIRPTNDFQPFVAPEKITRPWPRPALVAQLAALLKSTSSQSRIVVVAGESGTGKSVLIRRLLHDSSLPPPPR
jgi:hypothetical protein